MDQVEKFTELREKLTELQSKRDKAQGALDQVLSDLRAEFGSEIGSLDAAQALLRKEQKKLKRVESQLKDAIQQFGDKWEAVL